tara:strand:+ start:4444 stop:5133 length:690 start_codon:yes stop_codon:yes gene_type:complete
MIKSFLIIIVIFNFLFFSVSTAQTNTYPSSGNVGIGTVTPTAKLEVVHTGTIGSQWNPGNSYLTLKDGNNSLIMDVNEIYGSGPLFFGSANGDIANFRNVSSGSPVDRMIIKASGNVGIGTTVPDAMLTVKGNIHAKEIKVDLSVPAPDYVFKEDYDLRTLEETKSYIKENGHLPNIPSAQDFEENGLDLGVMNMKLLEKIEELTLYVIQQNEINIQLSQRIEELEKNK